MDRPAGCVTPRPGERIRHRYCPPAARPGPAADQHSPGAGSPDALVIADAGYDAPCLVHLLRDLPLQVLARMRSDRVLRRPAPTRQPHTGGRSPGTAASSVFGQPGTWSRPGHRKRHRHPYPRHRRRTLPGPAASQTHPPVVLGRGRQHPSSRREEGDPPGHRPSAQRCLAEAGPAVMVRHRRRRSGHRPALAGLPEAPQRRRRNLTPQESSRGPDAYDRPHAEARCAAR